MLAPPPKLLGGPGPPWPPLFLCLRRQMTDSIYVIGASQIYGPMELLVPNHIITRPNKKNLIIQSNFNGSNMSGSMKICSRQEQSVLMSVYHCARSGGIAGIFFDSINIKKEIFLKYFKYNNFCSYESFS